jgi:hypothetical protein
MGFPFTAVATPTPGPLTAPSLLPEAGFVLLPDDAAFFASDAGLVDCVCCEFMPLFAVPPLFAEPPLTPEEVPAP